MHLAPAPPPPSRDVLLLGIQDDLLFKKKDRNSESIFVWYLLKFNGACGVLELTARTILEGAKRSPSKYPRALATDQMTGARTSLSEDRVRNMS
jgi:hypothetical protein